MSTVNFVDLAVRRPRPSIQSLRGWHTFCSKPRTRRVPLPTPEALAALTPEERQKNTRDRMSWHSSHAPIVTNQMMQAHRAMNTKVNAVSNNRICGDGLLLDGESYAGKSTILTSWACDFELGLRAKNGIPFGGRLDGEWIYAPVVYVSASTSAGSSLRNIERFFDQKLPRHQYGSDMVAAVASHFEKSGTLVLIVDQFQELGRSTRGPGETSGFIKALMDAAPDTTIFGAGIGLSEMGILRDGHTIADERLAQTSHRFDFLPINSLRPNDRESAIELRRLLLTMEGYLDLLKAQPGDITKLEQYIVERTGGLTGSVMKLLRVGANEAIIGGEERITKAVLERVAVSAYADSASGHAQLTAGSVSGKDRRRNGRRS